MNEINFFYEINDFFLALSGRCYNKSWIAMGLTFFLVIVPLIGRGSTNFSKDNYFMILGDFLAQF